MSNANEAWNEYERASKERDVPALLAMLTSEELKARESTTSTPRSAAAKTLGEIRDMAAFEPLLEQIHDPDEYMRMYVAIGLGQLGDTRAIPHLIALLDDKEEVVRRKAGEALIAFGTPEAIDALLETLQRLDKDALRYGKDALYWMIPLVAKIDDPRVPAAMLALFRHSDVSVRQAAIDTFTTIADPTAFDALIEALTDSHWDARRAAMKALGHQGDQRAVAHLVPFLGSDTIYERRAAAEGLALLDWQPSADAAGAAYYAGQQDWDACVRLGPLAVEALVFEAKNHLAKDSPVQTLAKLGTPGIQALIELAKEDGSIANGALKELRQAQDPQAKAFIAQLIKDQQQALRLYWRDLAREWWQTQPRNASGICDNCNSELTRNNSFYHKRAARMLCPRCADSRLAYWEQKGGAPTYWEGDLEAALKHRAAAGSVDASRATPNTDAQPSKKKWWEFWR